MISHHTYKCWPRYFDALLDGSKTFEVRRDDRDVTPRSEDVVTMVEWEPHRDSATGRSMSMRVGYVLRGDGVLLPEGWVVFGVERLGGGA